MHELGTEVIGDEIVNNVTQVGVHAQGGLAHGAVDDTGLDGAVSIRPGHGHGVVAHSGHAGLSHGGVPHTDGFFFLIPSVIGLGHVLAGHASQALAVDAQ